MLLKLGAEDYDQVRRIFAPIEYNLAIESILSGLSPATVFVDDADRPKVALIWTGSRVFLGGKATDDVIWPAIGSTVVDQFYSAAAAGGLGSFTLHFTPGWETAIEYFLAEKNLMRDWHHSYALAASGLTWRPDLPAGYALRAVDRSLLAQSSLQHLPEVIEEMQSERPSVEDFLDKSFGYCAIYNDSIAGWCMSEYNCGNRCEIGIYTDEAHRRRGLATALATAVIEQAVRQGITDIGWHCWESNTASIATARRLGFALAARRPVYFGYIEPVQNLAANGYVSLKKGDPKKALEWFERAQALGDLPQWARSYLEQAKERSAV